VQPIPVESSQADDASLVVMPLMDISCPMLDLDCGSNPVRAIMQAPEFAETKRFFAEGPSATRSLLTDVSQALLYSVIRNLRPEHVVEVGTYKAGTAEGLARAVQANGFGTVHTISPFDAERFAAISVNWPLELQHAVRYHCMDSMAFFMEADQKRIKPGVVLIDGNHDYEFASFDIQATAQRLLPGGFIFVDNVSQAGPYFAAKDFLSRHPDWTDCGEPSPDRVETKAFFPGRSNVPFTDFLRAACPIRSRDRQAAADVRRGCMVERKRPRAQAIARNPVAGRNVARAVCAAGFQRDAHRRAGRRRQPDSRPRGEGDRRSPEQPNRHRRPL
jgi:predicted O-methyltransferase YrrM